MHRSLWAATARGKTTTIAMIMGLTLPTLGRYSVLGCAMLANQPKCLPLPDEF